MKKSAKNLFQTMPNVLGKVTVATLCMVFLLSTIILFAIGCDKNEATENLQYVKTELGGCNIKPVQENNDDKTIGDTVIITFSGDSAYVFIGLNYICKELAFETRYEIIDGVIMIYLTDSGGEYYRCTCYYTFDFVFTYHGEINQKYKIVLNDPREENPIIVSEGIMQNSINF